MPFYEHIFIARQDVSAQHVEELAAQLGEIIKEGGGTVTKTEHWGLRNLAYRINKNRKGHYVLMNLDAPHEAVAEMERNMRLNDNFIRQMTIRVEALDDGPSVMMKAKAARDSRHHRPPAGRGRGDRDGRPDRDSPGKKETKPEESKGTEAKETKATDKETKPEESTGKETKAKETEAKETKATDKETKPEESTGKETEAKETEARETKTKETEAKETKK